MRKQISVQKGTAPVTAFSEHEHFILKQVTVFEALHNKLTLRLCATH